MTRSPASTKLPPLLLLLLACLVSGRQGGLASSVRDFCGRSPAKGAASSLSQLLAIDTSEPYAQGDPCLSKTEPVEALQALARAAAAGQHCSASLEASLERLAGHYMTSSRLVASSMPEALMGSARALLAGLAVDCKAHASRRAAELLHRLEPQSRQLVDELRRLDGFMLPAGASLRRSDLLAVAGKLLSHIQGAAERHHQHEPPISSESREYLQQVRLQCEAQLRPRYHWLLLTPLKLAQLNQDAPLAEPMRSEVNSNQRLLLWINLMLTCESLRALDMFSQPMGRRRLSLSAKLDQLAPLEPGPLPDALPLLTDLQWATFKSARQEAQELANAIHKRFSGALAGALLKSDKHFLAGYLKFLDTKLASSV